MTTESPIQIIEAGRKWPSHNDMTAFGKPSKNMGFEDLGLVFKGQGQRFQEQKHNVAPNRSGSAPPSIEGSFGAIENLMIRQNFAHLNLNPRINPPLESSKTRNLFQRVPSTGNNRRLTSFDDSFSSSLQDRGNLSTHKEESDDDGSPKQRTQRTPKMNDYSKGVNDHSHTWNDHSLNSYTGSLKEDLPRAQSPAYNEPCSIRNEPNEEGDTHDDSDPTTATVSSSSSIDSRVGNMSIKTSMNKSLSGRSDGDVSVSGVTETNISSIQKGIVSVNIPNVSKLEIEKNEREWQQEHAYRQQPNAFHIQGARPQIISLAQAYVGMNQFLQTLTASEVQQPILNSSRFPPSPYATDPAYMTPGSHVYSNIMPLGYFPQQYALGGYSFNPSPISPYSTRYLPTSPMPTPFNNVSPSFGGQSQTSGVNLQHLNNFYGHLGLHVQPSFLEPVQLPTHVEDQKPQSSSTTSPYYFGSPTNVDFLQVPTSPFASPQVPRSPIGGASFPSKRNEGIYGGWKGEPKTFSSLEELKSGKGRRLELLDISGQVIEFSVDQHGSRFIQQKLEVCSNEEKELVFKEVIPHASRLITDVFGNYVIQKFFEYGSAEQRRELGNQLEGQILTLSLQMYGCRVIQKALDSIELEQKIKLVRELDGHIVKCVRDQNGNHVIQKCIESIPTENIKFVISSFRGQVAALSKHPYGCRVIQRVLEHSTDEIHIQFIVDEILDSVYDLAQDQYGNYVTQYVLEGGKPDERSKIVHKLAGHIVQLSQHKFASNVIEKCLEYGDSAARETMVEEIIGYADGSDNLLVMVKDQFANYVVQKFLQTCSGHQREVLLGRIKLHLNSLKKYTYGKHIVARFEQLYDEEIQASGS